MILHRLIHKGSWPFQKEITIDFDSLPTVLAIVGQNASGKSTILELIVSAFYGTGAFRPGPIHKNFTQQGYIDLTWSPAPGSPRMRSRLNVDPVAERTEMSLFLAEGGPAIAGPLARDYLAEMRKRVPPLDVFLSSAYSVQRSSSTNKNSFSFLLADRSDRREIFADLLGLKSYGMREAVAKDKIKALDTQIIGNEGLKKALEQDLLKRPAAVEKVQALTTRLGSLTAVRGDIKAAMESLQAIATDAKARLAALTPYRAQKDVLAAEIAALGAKKVTVEKGLAAARADISAGAEVEGAPAQKEALIAQKAALLPLKAQADDLEKAIQGLEDEVLEVNEAAARDEALCLSEERILAAVDQVEALQAQITARAAEIDQAEAADAEAAQAYQGWLSVRTDLEAKRAEEERLLLQVSTMADVPCKGQDEFAGCQFLSQATAAQAALPGVRAAVIGLEEQVGELRLGPTAGAPALKAKRATLLSRQAILAPLAAQQVDLASARSRVDALLDRKGRAMIALDDRRRDFDATTAEVTGLPAIEAALQAIEPKVTLAVKLGPARALEAQGILTLDEVLLALTDKQAALDAVTAALEAMPEVQVKVNQAAIFLAQISGDLRQSDSAIGACERELGSAQAELTRLDDTVVRLERLRAELVPLQADLLDWTLIAKSQGPTGIPALRVDRALPEIGERATELLRECLGEMVFTIQLVSQKPSADDKKLLETLDVLVLRNGTPMDAALLSGGEGVLVSEALSLAIALFNTDRSGGTRSYTLFRDEVGAALDDARAPAFTRLLSRAARLGGFDKILFVSHNTESIELADARLTFSNGNITVS